MGCGTGRDFLSQIRKVIRSEIKNESNNYMKVTTGTVIGVNSGKATIRPPFGPSDGSQDYIAQIVTSQNVTIGSVVNIAYWCNLSTAIVISQAWNTGLNIVNKNLLDNCYFDGGGSQKGYGVFPINQRGKTSYSELQQTMFDRWWHTNDPGTFELTDDGLKITAEAGTNACMAQFFDVIVSEDTEVTLSALYRGQIILDFYGYTHTPSPVVNDGWGMHAYTYTIPAGTNLADKLYCPTVKAVAGTTAYIFAVKFEVGNKQTLAYQDSNGIWVLFETQDYGETLAACQRYLLMGQILGVPVMTLSGGYGFFVATPQTMRTNPSVIGTPKIYKFNGIDDTGNEVAVSGFNTVLENNGVYIYVSGEFDGNTLCRLLFPTGTGLSSEL